MKNLKEMSVPKLIDVTPFEPLIIKTHFNEFDWTILEPVCERLIETTRIHSMLEEGDAKSSAANEKIQPHIMQEFKKFYDWIEPIAQHIMINEWGFFSGYEYKVTNSWVNYHAEGGLTSVHHHGPTTLTMAAYLQMPDEGGYIEFEDPLEHIKGFHMKKYDEEIYNWKQVSAGTGDVLIFPGWLKHRTQPNKNKNKKRWVLTTNYMSMFRPPIK